MLEVDRLLRKNLLYKAKMSKVEFCIFTFKFKYSIRFLKQMAYLHRENTYLFALSSTRCLFACFNATQRFVSMCPSVTISTQR